MGIDLSTLNNDNELNISSVDSSIRVRTGLSKKSFVRFHMARDEGLFILDWCQFYQPQNGLVRLVQSE